MGAELSSLKLALIGYLKFPRVNANWPIGFNTPLKSRSSSWMQVKHDYPCIAGKPDLLAISLLAQMRHRVKMMMPKTGGSEVVSFF